MYRVIRVVAFRAQSVTRMAVSADTGQSPNSVSMLDQRRIRLTGIEPAMGCDAGQTLNRYWVGAGLNCVYQVHHIDAYTDLSGMVVEGIGLHVEDILGSFNNYILKINTATPFLVFIMLIMTLNNITVVGIHVTQTYDFHIFVYHSH